MYNYIIEPSVKETYEEKGQEIFTVRKKYPHISWGKDYYNPKYFEYRIIGEGNYRESLIYTIDKLELNNEVLLTGAISHKEVKNDISYCVE